jgi:hypothetical protein
VTHGDADHFAGLTRIFRTEAEAAVKRLFLLPARVFHNGLVKGGSELPDVEAFGTTETVRGRRLIVDLHDDLREVDPSVMNGPFKRWREALDAWSQRGPIDVRRLERGDDSAFGFLRDEGIAVRVLGPVTEKAGERRALPFLVAPRSLSAGGETEAGAPSASHTINGHSIVLLVTYGDVRLLLAGDLNEESERKLVADHDRGTLSLTAEVLKVPHHGSADYSPAFLERVAPVVSVVSSGDEHEAKEHVHPRATLLGALGRFARPAVAEPVIFVTELAAFFKYRGTAQQFERTAYGMVRCRTDGKRLLVYTDTGKPDRKEAYAFTVEGGNVAPAPVGIV